MQLCITKHNNKRKDASQQTDINKRTRITLTALKKKIVTKSIDERRQTNLDEFFTFES